VKETLRVYIGGENRYLGQLKSLENRSSLSEIGEQVTSSKIILWGGEPTMREDLPALLGHCQEQGARHISIRTDGLIFTKEGMARVLKKKGLDCIYVSLPSSRTDACDWLLGKGFLGKVIRGIRNALQEDLDVVVDIPLTRSTIDHIGETIAMVHRLGIQKVLLRRLTFGRDESAIVALTPRFGILKLPLMSAINQAKRLGVYVQIEGIPDCILGELTTHRTKFSEGLAEERYTCISCDSRCCKLPEEYLARFGWAEVWDTQQDQKPTSLSLHFTAQESTRSIRQRLMLAAQSLVSELRILGDFSHPEIYPILRETLRLSIEKISLVGDLKPLRRLTKLELLRLRGVFQLSHRLTGTLVEPEVTELFERWKGPSHQLYVLIEDISEILQYDMLFQSNQLPSAPFFRMKGSGKIEDLVALLPRVSAESAAHLKLILPFCLHKSQQSPQRDNWMKYRTADKEQKMFDLFPRFRTCSYVDTCQQAECCVGLMEGYTTHTIKAITTDEQ